MISLKAAINKTIKNYGFRKIGDRRGMSQFVKEINCELSLSILVTRRGSGYPIIEVGVLHNELNINCMGKELYNFLGLPGLTFSECVIDNDFDASDCDKFISELTEKINCLVSHREVIEREFYNSMRSLENFKLYKFKDDADFLFMAVIYRVMNKEDVSEIIKTCKSKLINNPVGLRDFEFKLDKCIFFKENS